MIHLLFTLDSLIPILFVFFIKEKKNLFPSVVKEYVISFCQSHNFSLELYYKYKVYILAIAYFGIMVLLSSLIMVMVNSLSENENFKKGSIDDLEIATDNFLPSYLGYFFVALSIDDHTIFTVIFVFIFWFIKNSKQTHFNPVFIILGYKYYFINSGGVKSLVITKQNLRDPKEVELKKLKRINNYTYIELKY